MTKWFHKCDINWLKARQKYLTATDVKDLLPVTKTGRKRTIGFDDYVKVFARKMTNLTEDDCVSTGAAARGHILEPYAIDMYNENFKNPAKEQALYHWDDVVVMKDAFIRNPFGLAFSPDAMDFPLNSHTFNYIGPATGFPADPSTPEEIGEVKSYSPERHMVCGYTDPKNLEERWQIATAMAVRESIKAGSLLFYNPSMRNQLYVATYTRNDLAKEIEMVLEVENEWLKWLPTFGHGYLSPMINGQPDREQEIIDEIIARESLNPNDEKTVTR